MGRILVIDDSPTVVAGIRQALIADGHAVVTLETFLELSDLLRRDTPDLIVLDLNMPVLSGGKFGEYIRRAQPHPIPVVIYSSATSDEMRVVAKQVGAVAVVSKNDSVELLRVQVRKALRAVDR